MYWQFLSALFQNYILKILFERCMIPILARFLLLFEIMKITIFIAGTSVYVTQLASVNLQQNKFIRRTAIVRVVGWLVHLIPINTNSTPPTFSLLSENQRGSEEPFSYRIIYLLIQENCSREHWENQPSFDLLLFSNSRSRWLWPKVRYNHWESTLLNQP